MRLAGFELAQCFVALGVFVVIAAYGAELARPVVLAFIPLALAFALHAGQERLRRKLRDRAHL